MTASGLVLIGAGGHAHACIDVIERLPQYKIAGLVGRSQELGDLHLGYPVIGTDAELGRIVQQHRFAIISVGQIGAADTRERLYQCARRGGFTLPSIISPLASVSRHAIIGPGSIVMHGAIVNAGAVVGENCIVNSNALIEHDAVVEDHCHVSTGAILNGSVRVSSGSFIGSGSILKEAIVIGRGCLIGMGLSVRHDIPDGKVYLGK